MQRETGSRNRSERYGAPQTCPGKALSSPHLVHWNFPDIRTNEVWPVPASDNCIKRNFLPACPDQRHFFHELHLGRPRSHSVLSLFASGVAFVILVSYPPPRSSALGSVLELDIRGGYRNLLPQRSRCTTQVSRPQARGDMRPRGLISRDTFMHKDHSLKQLNLDQKNIRAKLLMMAWARREPVIRCAGQLLYQQ